MVCRLTPANGCCATCSARSGGSKASSFRITTRYGSSLTGPTPTAMPSPGTKPRRARSRLALEAARETITLLKNTNNLVPLNPGKIKSVAVIGPNADRELLGGYSGRPKFYTSLLEGIRAKIGDRVQVPYCEGCKITVGGSWNLDLVTPSHPEDDRKQIQEALKAAQHSDVIVLALGGNEQVSREAWSRKHLGDR